MAVNVLRIDLVGANPTKLLDPFVFQITVECIQQLPDDLEWRLTYVGSAESEKYDQILDSILVGPMMVGTSKFVLEAPGPDPALIPGKDAVGITCVLLTGLYQNKEFIRIGYFLNNEYENPEVNANPPPIPDFTAITRNLLIDKPRVTRYTIDWNGEAGSMQPFFPMETSNSLTEENMQVERTTATHVTQASPQKKSDGLDFVRILTPELSLDILRLLDIFSLARCSLASKTWKTLVDGGVQWSGVDLSEIEWGGFTQHEQTQLLSFVIGQCSPDLSSLNLNFCEGLDDQLLHRWLSKCQSVRVVELNWCVRLTPLTIDVVTSTCRALEVFKMIRLSEEDGTADVEKLCRRYGNQLKGLQYRGVSAAGLGIISETLANSLLYLSLPFSNISDRDLVQFLPRMRLGCLGVEMCRNVTAECVRQLRMSMQVVASHTPEDFVVEVSPGDEDDSIISIQLKDWPDDVDVSSIVGPLLPQGILNHTDTFRMSADPARVVAMFQQAGFVNASVKDDEVSDEEYPEDMIPCAVCGDTSLEDELVMCEECERGYHPDCLNPPLQELPEQNYWICADCSAEGRGEDLMEQSRKKRRT